MQRKLPILRILIVWAMAAQVLFSMPSFAGSPADASCGNMLPQLDALGGKLKLTERQMALWNDAISISKSMAYSHNASVDRMKAALKDPAVDLRVLFSKIDERQATDLHESRERREKWLEFYGSLDSAQRGIVRDFLYRQIEHL